MEPHLPGTFLYRPSKTRREHRHQPKLISATRPLGHSAVDMSPFKTSPSFSFKFFKQLLNFGHALLTAYNFRISIHYAT